MSTARPVIGVLCCNEMADRPVQSVASRFIVPLSRWAGATVLLVPAISEASDAAAIAGRLDGLLLTGSRSNVAPHRYGEDWDAGPLDEERDEVALALAGHMIEAGRPVFGICRGLQEINVLFGGTLAAEPAAGRHHRGDAHGGDFASLFDLRHEVSLVSGGSLARAMGVRSLSVTSVHEQVIGRLGAGLSVEARASDDGVIEAVSARPCGADVLAVQWHPEWDVAWSRASQRFFAMIGEALAGAPVATGGTWLPPVSTAAHGIVVPRGH